MLVWIYTLHAHNAGIRLHLYTALCFSASPVSPEWSYERAKTEMPYADSLRMVQVRFLVHIQAAAVEDSLMMFSDSKIWAHYSATPVNVLVLFLIEDINYGVT